MNLQISLPYLKKIFYEQKILMILLFFFCFIFTFVFMWVFFDSKIGPLFDTYMKLMPEAVKKIIGLQSTGGMFGVTMIAFAYRHPLLIILLSAVSLNLASRYISYEIETKTFDLLLSRSISRTIIPLNLYLVMIVFILIGFTGLLFGTCMGYYVFDLSEYIRLTDYFEISATGIIFFLCIGSFSLMIASFSNERGRALIIVLGILVFLFFIDSIIRVTDSLAGLEPFSFFELYRPVKMVLGKKGLWDSLPVLLFLNALFFTIAHMKFKKRDL